MINPTWKASTAALAACIGFISVQALPARADTLGATGPRKEPKREIAIGSIYPSRTVKGAMVSSGGVGLRNRASGAIEISGPPGRTKSAYLYWAVISDGPPPTDAAKPTIQKVGPVSGKPRQLSGRIIGSGLSPCWNGTEISVYKATVPNSIVKGNGTYVVQVPPKSAGSFSGRSPWEDRKFPLWEGASLVVISSGKGTVEIFDSGLAGQTAVGYSEGISYTLKSRKPSSTKTLVLHNIGADGQRHEGFEDLNDIGGETTTINGTFIAGPYSPAPDSDWNGQEGGPITQMWDNTQHEISSLVYGSDLSVYIDNKRDCLTPVANILHYR